jgi:hypothetical protein
MTSPCCLYISSMPDSRNSGARRAVVARRRLGKQSGGNEYTRKNRTVGCDVFYTVRVVSNTQYVVKGEYAISSSQWLHDSQSR